MFVSLTEKIAKVFITSKLVCQKFEKLGKKEAETDGRARASPAWPAVLKLLTHEQARNECTQNKFFQPPCSANIRVRVSSSTRFLRNRQRQLRWTGFWSSFAARSLDLSCSSFFRVLQRFFRSRCRHFFLIHVSSLFFF